MESEEVDELQSQAPPNKRARVGTLEDAAREVASPFDDMEDIYGTPADTPKKEARKMSEDGPARTSEEEKPVIKSQGIPGLGLLGPEAKLEHGHSDVPVTASTTSTSESTAIESAPENATIESEVKPEGEPTVEEPASITEALENLLGGITPPAEPENHDLRDTSNPSIPQAEKSSNDFSVAAAAIGLEIPTEEPASPTTVAGDVQMIEADAGNLESHDPEFEIDSSPYESSSDDSSDDSSSEEDSDDEDPYQLLDPEEQARILMEGDGGSDDEGGGKGAKSSGGQLRTKNEVPEEVIPKPDVTITPEMKIEELGDVEHIVENIVVIKANTSGEYRVLESGSVLCLENRSVIGAVSETLGRVQQPLYSVLFTNSAEIEAAGLQVGTKVFYSEQHSTYVFTQALKAFKGSDASNLHDEEVGDEEIEFSDDEAEMEHKRKIKQKRMERRGGKQHHDDSGRGGHPLRQEHTPVGLSYDDAEDEGPYKPLARPAAYADAVGRFEAPQEEAHDSRGARAGRDDHRPSGRGGHRGQRGRDRGGRGQYNRGGRSDGYSRPPQAHNNGYSHSHTHPAPAAPNAPTTTYNYPHSQQAPQYPPQQPPIAYPYPPVSQSQQQHYYNTPQQPANSAHLPTALPTGAYFNPAFFGQQQPTASYAPPSAAAPPFGSQNPNPNQYWSAQQAPPQWTPPSGPPPPPANADADAQRAFNEAQEKLNILRSLSGSR